MEKENKKIVELENKIDVLTRRIEYGLYHITLCYCQNARYFGNIKVIKLMERRDKLIDRYNKLKE